MEGFTNGIEECPLHLPKDDGIHFARTQLFVDPYIDDIIIGTTTEDPKDLIAQHSKDVQKVLATLEKYDILVNPKKVQMFMKQVEFCVHILSEGKRLPLPGNSWRYKNGNFLPQ